MARLGRKDKAEFIRLLNEFDKAAQGYAFKGAQLPAEALLIEKQYELAKTTLMMFLFGEGQ